MSLKGGIPCPCDGSNETCSRCFGTGVIGQNSRNEDLERVRARPRNRMPPSPMFPEGDPGLASVHLRPSKMEPGAKPWTPPAPTSKPQNAFAIKKALGFARSRAAKRAASYIQPASPTSIQLPLGQDWADLRPDVSVPCPLCQRKVMASDLPAHVRAQHGQEPFDKAHSERRE